MRILAPFSGARDPALGDWQLPTRWWGLRRMNVGSAEGIKDKDRRHTHVDYLYHTPPTLYFGTSTSGHLFLVRRHTAGCSVRWHMQHWHMHKRADAISWPRSRRSESNGRFAMQSPKRLSTVRRHVRALPGASRVIPGPLGCFRASLVCL